MKENGFSTFFPKDCKVRQPGSKNVFVGRTAAGMLIKLRLDAKEMITTAFPMTEEA